MAISSTLFAVVALCAAPIMVSAADPVPPPSLMIPVRAAAELPAVTAPPVPEAEVPPPIPVLVPGRTVLLQKESGDDTPKRDDNDTDRLTKVTAADYVRLPTKRVAFRLESDPELEKRILKELDKAGRSEYLFPNAPKLTPDGAVYQAKTVNYPPVRALVEPGYVVHRRLYFEDQNSERYGWDAGVLQPVVSTLLFYKDTLLWVPRLASSPHERYATDAGKCPPGSPMPYYLYPPEIDIWGYSAGIPWYVGLAFIFP